MEYQVDGLETVKIRRVVKLNPTSSRVSDLPHDTQVSFIPLDGFGEDGDIRYEEEKDLAEVIEGYTYFEEGDIAIAKITPSFENGKGAICDPLANEIGFGTTELHILRPTEKIDTRFLWYCLRTKQFFEEAKAAMRGTAGQQRVPSEFIANYEIPYPPVEKQRSISNYLEGRLASIEDARRTSLRLREITHKKRQALIREAATSGIKDSSRMKSSDVGWIGSIPENWDVVRTRFVARLESGHTPSRSNEDYWEDADIPWVSLADSDRLRKNNYISDTEKYTNSKGLENSSAHILPENTVVMTRDATVGLCSIIEQPMAVSQHIVGWVCGPDLLPEYLLFVLQSMDQEFDRLSRGSTISTIGMRDIESFMTPLPPIEDQREIVEHIKRETKYLWNLVEGVDKTIGLLEEKRQALITAAVTGQIGIVESQDTDREVPV